MFNGGKPYHGSAAVQHGRLRGATDTDYFYFHCPRCDDEQVMRVLDFEIVKDEPGNPYNEQMRSKAARTFTIAFKIHCENCNHTDFVKISNAGWQAGSASELTHRRALTE